MTKPATPTRSRGALSEEAYGSLRSALITGTIAPGEPLSEPQLAEMLETSRSPVREALSRLMVDGFVERTGTGRLRAARLDLKELEDLYVLRAAIEGLAVRLATPRVTMHDLDAMAETISRMEDRAADGDIPGSMAAGAAFHAAIQARCDNAPLSDTIDSVRLRIVRYRSIIAAARPREFRASEHRAVLQAMLDRDPDLAEREMTRHVEASAEAISLSIQSCSAAMTGADDEPVARDAPPRTAPWAAGGGR